MNGLGLPLKCALLFSTPYSALARYIGAPAAPFRAITLWVRIGAHWRAMAYSPLPTTAKRNR